MVSGFPFVCSYDYGREWIFSTSISGDLFLSPLDTIKRVYLSINNDDYNLLMPTLMALPLKLFGADFASYAMSVHILFLCPAIFSTSLCTAKLLRVCGFEKKGFMWLLLPVCATPILYYALFMGFMDAPALIVISSVLMVSLEFDYRKIDIGRCLLISSGLIAVMLFRRYFAYWVVGFIVSQAVMASWQFYFHKEDRFLVFRGFTQNMAIIGGISLSVLLILFRNFLYRSFFNNFSIAYSAWKGTLGSEILKLVEIYGLFFLVLSLLLPLILLCLKRNVAPYISAFFVNIAVTAVLMWRVVKMDYHHNYLIIIQLLLLAAMAVTAVFVTPKKIWRIMISSVLVLVISLNFYNYFGERPIGAPILAQTHYTPNTKSDIAEIQAMVSELNELSANDKKIYVLSSSGILNPSILSWAFMPETVSALPNLAPIHEVDLRDGFPEAFFTSDIVVVCDPIQIHLPEGTQEIVRYLAELVLNQSSYLGRHYRLMNEYFLENNVCAKIYVKESRFTEDDYDDLWEYFHCLYPEYPQLFENRIAYASPFFPEKAGESRHLSYADNLLYSEFPMEDGVFKSTGIGCLVYGPYKELDEGSYKVVFKYRYKENADVGAPLGVVDAYASGTSLSEAAYFAGHNQVVLNLKTDRYYPFMEFRMMAHTADIEFVEMTVTRVS
jgi:hypothetical protein